MITRETYYLRLRRDLLKIMNSPKTPLQHQVEAQRHYISLHTSTPDEEVIRNFVRYKR